MSTPAHRSASGLGLVAAGGGLGALARYGVAHAMPTHDGGWPFATLTVNVVGAFVLGLLLESLTRLGPDIGARRHVRLAVGTGFCGAFTTYSTFAHDVQTLGDDAWSPAGAWAVGHVIAGLLAAGLGVWVATRITRPANPREVS